MHSPELFLVNTQFGLLVSSVASNYGKPCRIVPQ